MTSPHPAESPGRRAVELVGLVVAVVVALLSTGVRPAAAAGPVDDWGRDPDVLSGTIDEICGPAPSHDASAARPGRVALMAWFDATFPEIEGFGGFACREIHNRRSACPGRPAPARSDCWSTHAAGRAIDIMTGGSPDQDGPPVGKALGDRIVDLLLAEVDGVVNHRARVMGIQQLLWDGTCWSVSEHADAAITTVDQLDDDCIDGHDDHVHVTLSEAGADGRTSFHTGEVVRGPAEDGPIGDPRDAHLLAWDATEGRLLLRGVDVDGTFIGDEATADLAGTWTTVATPDVGGNGNDELFAYDAAEGTHLLREIRADGTLGSTLDGDGTLGPGWTLVATPDVDGDGDDELLLYRGDDGTWALHELRENGDLGPALPVTEARLDVFYSSAATPDVDGDGDDELLLYRRFDGHHVLLDFADADALAAPADPAHSDLDVDGDGLADVTVALAPMAPLLVDADGLPVDAGVVEPPALGASLTAGFTTLSAVDIDADGIDELALYRQSDGCLALRTLRRPTAVAADAADQQVSSEAGTLVAEPVQPCLAGPPPDGADEDASESGIQALDPETWLLESHSALEPGWTSLVGVAVD